MIRGLHELVFYAPSSKSAYPLDMLLKMHKIIILEEFNIHNWDLDFLTKLLAGNAVTIKRKYCDEREYRNKLPIIMVSNYRPLDSLKFLSLVVAVHADKSFFQISSEDRSTISTDAIFVPSSPFNSEILSSPVL